MATKFFYKKRDIADNELENSLSVEQTSQYFITHIDQNLSLYTGSYESFDVQNPYEISQYVHFNAENTGSAIFSDLLAANRWDDREETEFQDSFDKIYDKIFAETPGEFISSILPEDVQGPPRPPFSDELNIVDTEETLFLEFAYADFNSTENIRKIATKYGLLGKFFFPMGRYTSAEMRLKKHMPERYGEPVEYWRLVQYFLRVLIGLWRDIAQSEQLEFENFFKYTPYDNDSNNLNYLIWHSTYNNKSYSGELDHFENLRNIFRLDSYFFDYITKLDIKDYKSFRKVDLLKIILQRVLSLLFLRQRDHQIAYSLSTFETADVTIPENKIVLCGLDSALWAQFFNAISLGKKFRKCYHCGKWMSVSGKGKSQKLFCSPKCRTACYRLNEKISSDPFFIHGSGPENFLVNALSLFLRISEDIKPLGPDAIQIQLDPKAWLRSILPNQGNNPYSDYALVEIEKVLMGVSPKTIAEIRNYNSIKEFQHRMPTLFLRQMEPYYDWDY